MKTSTASLVGMTCAAALFVGGCGDETQDPASAPTTSVTTTTEETSGVDETTAAEESASEGTESEETSDESNEEPAGDSSFKDGVLTTPDLKIVITDHKVIPVGEEGNEYGEKPVIAFWYEITNLSDQDVTPMDFMFHITAYQDNNPNAENQINVGMLPDERFLDSQMENIKKGGTVENAIAYELDDETTPVDLKASDILGDEWGTTTYEIKQ